MVINNDITGEAIEGIDSLDFWDFARKYYDTVGSGYKLKAGGVDVLTYWGLCCAYMDFKGIKYNTRKEGEYLRLRNEEREQ